MGGKVGGDAEGAPSGRRPTARGERFGGRAHQRRREPGRQVNVHGIPPPPARERSRNARRRRPASAPLARLPSANRAPTPLGPNPTGPPPQGPPSEPPTRPAWSVPEPRPGGKRPPGESGPTRAHTSPPAATRPGSGQRQTAARSAQGRRRTAARERPRARALATHTGAPRARRRPGPAGSSPDSEGGGAGRGRQESDARPHRGAGRPLAERGLCPTRNGSHPASVATTRRGGAAAGGSGTPRHPLGSLEKAFSPRAHRPHPFVPPTEPRERASRRPPRAWGRGWVRGKGRAQGNPERPRPGPNKGAAFASPHTPCSHHRPEGTLVPPPGPREERRRARHAGQKSSSPRLAKRHSAGTARHGRSHTPPSPVHTTPPARRAPGDDEAPTPPTGGAGWASLTGSTTRPSDTPPTAAARGGRWERETTPPLGLRHLRQPGALQGHHRGPGATHSARPGGEQRGMGTALPTTGRAAHPAGSQERQARVSAASEDPTPTGTLRQEPWESGVGPEPTHPPHLPPTHTPPATAGGRGGGGARDPWAEREERSHSPGMSVPRLTRLRPGPGEHDITTSISKKRARGGPKGGNARRGHRPEGTCFRPRQHPLDTQGKDSRATQGERLTRGTEPCGMEWGLPRLQPGACSAERTG